MTNEHYMNIAISLAKKAAKRGDVPVGAVIVNNGKILSKAYNKKNAKKNALYHAEVLAINKACKKVKNFRLENTTIYVTKEPCLMCMGAILSARMNHIVFGSYDKKYGCITIAENNNFNHKSQATGGVCEKECSELITSFFSSLRKNKQKNNKK